MRTLVGAQLRSPRPVDDETVDLVTAWLRTAQGTMTLRPIQARALLEAALYQGLFCSARVGAGKTIISGLLPTVWRAKRPLLIVPANLVKKTKRELKALRLHWQIPHVRIESYSKLGHKAHARLLWDYAPDGLIFDEAHKLKRVRTAACARRVARFIHEFPQVPVATLTGTPMRASVWDFWHLLLWALRDRAPVPADESIMREWSACLDDEDQRVKAGRTGGWTTADYSILEPWLGRVSNQTQAREAFAARLTWTPGVVISTEGYRGVGLSIAPIHLEPPAALEEIWLALRKTWTMPDDWLLPDKQIGVWNAAQELALGFYNRHDPRPPEDWMQARRAWCGFCRRVLEGSDEYDTETQVRDACLRGDLPRFAWDEWAKIKGEFIPETKPVWLSDHAVKAAAQWGKGGGIIWSRRTAFARALAELTGWPYYGREGRNDAGVHVEQATEPTIIVSEQSSTEGRNLQIGCGPDGLGYCRNLFCSPPKASLDWEQRVGRTHRDLQTRDVTVDYLVGCLENWVALQCAIGYGSATTGLLTQETKFDFAHIETPPESWLVGPAFGVYQ
jgi:hypothetical protein